jgi:hypothetical protein
MVSRDTFPLSAAIEPAGFAFDTLATNANSLPEEYALPKN